MTGSKGDNFKPARIRGKGRGKSDGKGSGVVVDGEEN